jgi:hypothetical protein
MLVPVLSLSMFDPHDLDHASRFLNLWRGYRFPRIGSTWSTAVDRVTLALSALHESDITMGCRTPSFLQHSSCTVTSSSGTLSGPHN